MQGRHAVNRCGRAVLYGVAWLCLICSSALGLRAQIDVSHVISIGRNALYFNDYVVSIGYFNRAIDSRPWIAEPYLYRAIAKISLEDYQGALLDADLCLERNPFLSRAYLVKGVSQQNLGLYAEALQTYKQGLELVPNQEDMHYNMAVAQLMLKRYDDAEQSLTNLRHYNPRSKRGTALLANIALEKRDTTLALQRIDQAIAEDAYQAMPHKLRAQVAMSRGELSLAKISLSHAIELEPEQADLYTNRAIVSYKLNDLKDAMGDYGQALKYDPRSKVALHNRALLRMTVGEYGGALQDWDKLLAIDPLNHIAYYNRALVHERLRQYRKAVADVDVILKEYPSFIEGFFKRAALKKQMGDHRGAERDNAWAVNLMQNRKLRRSLHSQAVSNSERADREREEKALDTYNQIIEERSEPKPSKLRYNSKVRGRIQEAQAQVQMRPMFYLSYLVSVADENGLVSRTYYAQLLDQLNALGKPEERLYLSQMSHALTEADIQRLQTIIGQEAGSSDRLGLHIFRRAVAYALLQDYDEAIRLLGQSLEAEPENALIYFARALAHSRSRELQADRMAQSESAALGAVTAQESDMHILTSSSNRLSIGTSTLQLALNDLDRCIGLVPTFAYAYYNRALVYYQHGEHARALEDYNQALRHAPNLAEAYFNRALLLLEMGRKQEAMQDLSRAGELGIHEVYSILKRIQ